jgi:integrase
MARGLNLLSEKFTQKKDLKPGLYSDGGGLCLQVSAYGTKAWIFRYMLGGRARKMGLGDFELVSLKKAREKRSAAYALVKDGIDPIEERKARTAAQAAETAKALTFRECAEGYIEAHRAGWKNAKHAAQWTATLETYVFPTIGKLRVQDIETVHIEKILRPIWFDKTETASRVRGRIEKVLDRAKVLGLRSGDNPARWTGHLSELFPARAQVSPVEHHPAMPYADMPDFLAKLRAKEGSSARALEWTILTACRTGDAIGAQWPEVNEQEKLWTVPASRLKGRKGANRRDHVVPLSERAMEILQTLPRDGEFLFIGGGGAGLSNAAMSELLKGMGYAPDYATVHGFRSTFMDWVHDVTSFPKEMADIALAHVVSDKVEAAYRRGDMLQKRRRLMDAWADFCAGRTVGGDVLPFKKSGGNSAA